MTPDDMNMSPWEFGLLQLEEAELAERAPYSPSPPERDEADDLPPY